LTGKVLIDCTNPIGPNFTSAVGPTTSGAETVARWAEGARVVKAFNTTGFNVMEQPGFGAEAASMFICGDDAAAKSDVTALAEQLGFEVVDCGPLANARLLENLALLWISLARQGLGRDIAFKLLRR
jgi:predicted dinucleotide-binding enzyme